MPAIVRTRHGLTDQEAPQAHAQEEAQEASEEDPLAASSAGQVAAAAPSGRPSRTPALARCARPRPDPRPRRRCAPAPPRRRPRSGTRPRTTIRCPRAAPARPRPRSTAALNATSRGSTWCAAGSRSLRSGGSPSMSTVVADRAAELVPRAVHVGGRAAERRRRDHDRELGQDHAARARRRRRARASRRRRAGRTARRRRASAAIRSTSRKWTSTPATAGAPMSTAAASAEPPPSPAPGGMPLCSSIADVRAARVAPPAHARFVPSAGTPSAYGPVTVERRCAAPGGSRARRAARSPRPPASSSSW